MKLSNLVANRETIVRIAHLTQLAVAYDVLNRMSERVARARLSGWVNLKGVDPHEERFLPSLVAIDGNQSVIEEHFDEDDLIALAEAVSVIAPEGPQGTEFRLEEIEHTFAAAVLEMLMKAGVEIDVPARPRAASKLKEQTSDAAE